MNDFKDTSLFALDTLLDYAKYLEDNGQLSYELLKQRVESYREKPEPEIGGEL